MVAQAAGYYVALFRGERGVAQGDPLSPTIFNVVLDAVGRHWESLLMAEREGGDSSGDERDGALTAGRTIQEQDEG